MHLEEITEEAVELTRGDAGLGSTTHFLERGEDPTEMLPGAGRETDDRGVIEKEEVAADHLRLFPLRGAAAILLADEVPFVEQHHAGLARFLKHPCDSLVL